MNPKLPAMLCAKSKGTLCHAALCNQLNARLLSCSLRYVAFQINQKWCFPVGWAALRLAVGVEVVVAHGLVGTARVTTWPPKAV